jgi:DNA-binding response OmpR family regulator
MARLRRKLDLESSPKLLHTIRGVGFLVGEQRP